MAGRRNHSAWLLLRAALLLVAATAATAQNNCSSAKFPAGRSFQRCTSLPVLGASLHWTYHPENGTADIAFRAQSGADGWVGWGINPNSRGMVGSSVFVATQSSGSPSVLMTNLDSTSPSLQPATLKFNVPVAPTVEYSGGAYTIFATIALPGNATQQNTVWQAGSLSGGQIAPHPTAPANLASATRLDFLSGSSTGASNSRLRRKNVSSSSISLLRFFPSGYLD